MPLFEDTFPQRVPFLDARRPSGATGEISVMGPSGDEKHYWDVKSWDQVSAAKAKYDEYRAKGFAAFRMSGDGKGEQMDEFDPSAGSVLLIPPLSGG